MQDTYTILRHFADSWMLLTLTGIFLGVCFWAFRPGSRAIHDDAANAIFREGPGCDKGCAQCSCGGNLEDLK